MLLILFVIADVSILCYFSFRITVWKVLFKTLLMVLYHRNLGFLFLSRCLIFKVQSLPPSRGQLKEYIISYTLLSILFESFLDFFQNLFLSPKLWLFSRSFRVFPWELVYIIISFPFCQHFLQTFLSLLHHIFSLLYTLPGVFVCPKQIATIYWANLPFSCLTTICGCGIYRTTALTRRAVVMV